ncbi:helix-turn-helix domain-containing protein [Schaedlerella arabinosiphila]|uniref:helix-turn-helix domain-containing protein n=1 Tax=Schaedlerella arabinosiphila TaxID=2044587 RepID=UPI00138FDEE4|nr:helix-turn-helix transcriptional regulator [Schaedlerella arabinosiphila]
MDNLSDFSGISKPHLIRLFRKYVGCTPREYILRLQIENAKQLLESTALTIKQIGIMVGIEDANYFSRFFKSRAGLSPQDWRTTHRV